MSTELSAIDILTFAGEGDQHITFLLGEEEYALDILAVQEIVRLPRITHVPNLPAFMRGVINLRGVVVPVIDVRVKFGIGQADYDKRTCIIIVKMAGRTMGMIVDRVSEVLRLPEGSIEPPPPFGTNIKADFIKGMGKVDERLLIILDLDKVLSNEEVSAIVNV